MESIITPTAREPLHKSATAWSPFILPLLLILNRKNAATIHTGIATLSGAVLNAVASASAANPTWERPSPIIEYLFKTMLTPSNDAHKVTKSPTTTACTIKS